MNDLILYLYQVDFLTNLGLRLGLLIIILGVTLIVTAISVGVQAYNYGFGSVKSFLNTVYKPLFIIFCALCLLKAIIPSK